MRVIFTCPNELLKNSTNSTNSLEFWKFYRHFKLQNGKLHLIWSLCLSSLTFSVSFSQARLATTTEVYSLYRSRLLLMSLPLLIQFALENSVQQQTKKKEKKRESLITCFFKIKFKIIVLSINTPVRTHSFKKFLKQLSFTRRLGSITESIFGFNNNRKIDYNYI